MQPSDCEHEHARDHGKGRREEAYPAVVDKAAEEGPDQQVVRPRAVRRAAQEELHGRIDTRVIENHNEEPGGIIARLPDEQRHQHAHDNVREAHQLRRAVDLFGHGDKGPEHRDSDDNTLDNPEQLLFQSFEVVPESFYADYHIMAYLLYLI